MVGTMTLKEFSEKYNVPYKVPYQATYRVKSYSTWMHDREYPEQELRDEAIRLTEIKAQKYKELYEKQLETLRKLKA